MLGGLETGEEVESATHTVDAWQSGLRVQVGSDLSGCRSVKMLLASLSVFIRFSFFNEINCRESSSHFSQIAVHLPLSPARIH